VSANKVTLFIPHQIIKDVATMLELQITDSDEIEFALLNTDNKNIKFKYSETSKTIISVSKA